MWEEDNHFQMDIPTVGPPVAHKPYVIPLKYWKFVKEEIKLLENAGCIPNMLTSMGCSSYHLT